MEKNKTTNQGDLRDYYAELQIIDKHIQELQKQIQVLDEQTMELAYVHQCIDDMKNMKKDNKTLVPLSNGIFMEAEIKDTKSLFVNVGANVVLKKSVDDAAGMIADQSVDLTKFRDNLDSAMKNLVNKAMEIESKIKKLRPDLNRGE